MIEPIAPSEHLDPAVVADLRALGIPGEDVLADVISLFLADVPSQLSALATALEACDCEATWQVAHRLKGTALGMGAWRMAKMCATVEYWARGEALARAAEHAVELVTEFEATCRALEQEVS
jgi:HPt (histidine-containing phosphotransfer) domain-containing protein